MLFGDEPGLAVGIDLGGFAGREMLGLHLLDVGAIDDWAVEVPDEARALVDACWPGPLTLVLRRSARASDAVTGGLDTVALRVPALPVMRAVLAEFGGAIAAPSANRFGRVSPTSAGTALSLGTLAPGAMIGLWRETKVLAGAAGTASIR